MNNSKILIIGGTGQDGSLLCSHILRNNSNVNITILARNISEKALWRLKFLGIVHLVNIIQCDVQDRFKLFGVIELIKPDYVFNLSGQSSVAVSFNNPSGTIDSIVNGGLNIIESCLFSSNNRKKIVLFNALSQECFGDTDLHNGKINENCIFKPINPYGVAKAKLFDLSLSFRDRGNFEVINGFLFIHDSHLRGKDFVVSKISDAIVNYMEGDRATVSLGNIDKIRDWGWAPEYIEIICSLLKFGDNDVIISTGVGSTLRSNINIVCNEYGIKFNKLFKESREFSRLEPDYMIGDNSRLFKILNKVPNISKELPLLKTIAEVRESRGEKI